MKLKDVAHIRAGHAFRRKLINEPDQEVRVIQMKDLNANGDIHWHSMVKTGPVSQNRDWVTKNDLLLVSRGANNTTYFINEQPIGLSLAAPYFFHITVLPDALELIVPEFLAWQLNQINIQHYYRTNAEGSTSKAIRREIVENTQLVTPSIEKQMKVVALNRNVTLQNQIQQQLIKNREALMNKIAADLLN